MVKNYRFGLISVKNYVWFISGITGTLDRLVCIDFGLECTTILRFFEYRASQIM
jgi:hypothetical protein